MEHEVLTRYQKIEDLSRNLIQLSEKLRDLDDLKCLLYRAREIFYSNNPDTSTKTYSTMSLVTVAGIINRSDILRFNKMIFRATKGNNLMYTFDVPTEENTAVAKSVFIILIESGGLVRTKITRICDSFAAKRYPLPENKEEYFDKLLEIDTLVADTLQLKGVTEKNLKDGFADMT